MQRLRVPGGRLSGRQWQVLADLARDFTPQTPLHLTTRQDLEFHDLTDEQVPAVQRALAEAGLSTVGACGDTFRNVTICPCSGLLPGTVDLLPLAGAICRQLEALPGIRELPRKFKINLSCGPQCGQPWINDLGLVATRKDARWGFAVMTAGSLGAKPGTGILLFEWISPEEVLPLVVGAVRVFAAHGDRSNRRQARLRHVRERIGDADFVAMMRQAFDEALVEKDWPSVDLPENTDGLSGQITLRFANGDVSPEAADALSRLESRDDVAVRIDSHQRIVVFGPSVPGLENLLADLPALQDATRPQPSIVACPGNRWCKLALTDTNALADAIRTEAPDLPADWTICISGCPNGCAQSGVADAGLSGVVVTRDGQKEDAYNLLTGGGMGRTAELAKPVAQKLSVADVIERLKSLAAD